MNIFQSIALGIIQGITEFLPISSSAHLVVARWFLNWSDPGIAFDVMLHLGTLVGVVWFFWKTWMKMFKSFFSQKTDNKSVANRKLFLMIIIATIPAGLAGYFFNDYVEKSLRSPMVIGWAMIIFGLLLYVGDKISKVSPFPKEGLRGVERSENVSWLQSIFIGFSQAIALIPGVSRSGVTMTAGLFSGLNRKTAAEFSFLLSAPIILGAGIKKIPEIVNSGGSNLTLFAGFFAAAISGFFAVRFLIKYLEKGSFKPFVWYRIGLGFLILGMLFL